jgi:ferredoxin
VTDAPYERLRVARIVQETPDARSLVLDVPDALREAFAYRAGQFLTFRVPVDGRRLVRCYSLASAPGVDPEWKVTVKRVARGRVSNWMNDAVREGDALEVMRPAGRFCASESGADELPYRPGDTVVEALRRAGLEPPTSCEGGYCGCCMAHLRGGTGQMKNNEVLDASQLADGWVLTCQLVPAGGKVRIEYPD